MSLRIFSFSLTSQTANQPVALQALTLRPISNMNSHSAMSGTADPNRQMQDFLLPLHLEPLDKLPQPLTGTTTGVLTESVRQPQASTEDRRHYSVQDFPTLLMHGEPLYHPVASTGVPAYSVGLPQLQVPVFNVHQLARYWEQYQQMRRQQEQASANQDMPMMALNRLLPVPVQPRQEEVRTFSSLSVPLGGQSEGGQQPSQPLRPVAVRLGGNVTTEEPATKRRRTTT
jgi:hypothetical protein